MSQPADFQTALIPRHIEVMWDGSRRQIKEQASTARCRYVSIASKKLMSAAEHSRASRSSDALYSSCKLSNERQPFSTFPAQPSAPVAALYHVMRTLRVPSPSVDKSIVGSWVGAGVGVCRLVFVVSAAADTPEGGAPEAPGAGVGAAGVDAPDTDAPAAGAPKAPLKAEDEKIGHVVRGNR